MLLPDVFGLVVVEFYEVPKTRYCVEHNRRHLRFLDWGRVDEDGGERGVARGVRTMLGFHFDRIENYNKCACSGTESGQEEGSRDGCIRMSRSVVAGVLEVGVIF